MTRLLLAASLLLAAPLTAAQTASADPWPLVPGNSWTYTYGPLSNPGPATTWTVLDSVDTAVGRLPRIQRSEGWECVVTRQQVGPVLEFRGLSVSGNAPCGSGWSFFMGGDGVRVSIAGPFPPPSPLRVGYETIDDYEYWGWYEDGGMNPSYQVRWWAAGGIGLTGIQSIRRGGGVPQFEILWSLRFATVGGRTYGTPVAGEAVPAGAEALALTVGPNPVRASAQVAFSLPAASEARIEVLDALGRTVQRLDLGTRSAGTNSARLDVSGLAAGVYSVRLVAGDVQTAAGISVVR